MTAPAHVYSTRQKDTGHNRMARMKTGCGRYRRQACNKKPRSARQEPPIKTNKKGEKKEYLWWVASWRESDRYRKVYPDSCRKLSHEADGCCLALIGRIPVLLPLDMAEKLRGLRGKKIGILKLVATG